MSYWNIKKKYKNISALLGKTIVEIVGGKKGDEEITIKTSDNKTYIMYHQEVCCENVEIEDVIGDLIDLIDSPITMAEEVIQEGEDDKWGGTSTWTFYKLATNKGYVTIRWLGESNGHYSEYVEFIEILN